MIIGASVRETQSCQSWSLHRNIWETPDARIVTKLVRCRYQQRLLTCFRCSGIPMVRSGEWSWNKVWDCPSINSGVAQDNFA